MLKHFFIFFIGPIPISMNDCFKKLAYKQKRDHSRSHMGWIGPVLDKEITLGRRTSSVKNNTQNNAYRSQKPICSILVLHPC